MPGRPELLIMCGLSFSGKTRLAGEISMRYQCPVISLDAIREARGLDGEEVTAEERRLSHASALEHLDDMMRNKTPLIIVDDTSNFRSLRDNYRYVASRYGYRTRLVVLDTPLNVIHARRNDSTDKSPITEAIFDEHCRQFQWPDPDEKALNFHHETHLDAWLEEHFLTPAVAPV